MIALSETEPLIEKLLQYQFPENSSINGHKMCNLLLTALKDITGNISEGVEALGKILNLKGKVVPLTEDVVDLVGIMEDGGEVFQEHNITADKRKIKEVYYQQNPTVHPEALLAIQEADLIVLSMGSLFTSVIPNLICPEITEALEKSKAKIMYICNIMTQPGESDNFKVSDHVKALNHYLGNRHVDVVLANNGYISSELIEKYSVEEQKEPVILDTEELKKLEVELIEDNFVHIYEKVIRHHSIKIALHVFSYLL